jgi:putative transcriptional regulator
MSVNHHPSEAWLMDYALGNLPDAFETILTAHVGTCPSCRSDVALAERLGGEILARGNQTHAAPRPVDPDMLPEVDSFADDLPSRAVDVGANGGFDFFVRTYLKCSSDSLRWRRLGGGLQICRLTEEDNIKMWLLKARPGKVLPQHTHEGSELTLVLKGAYFCGEDLFKAGDIEDADETTYHQPMVTGNDECICLAATEGSLKFDSLVARLAQKFVGI